MNELVKRASEKVLTEMKPKEDTYSAESFLKHQEMCHDPSCPVCSVMNDKLKDVKVSNVLDKVGDTLHNLNERKENDKKRKEKTNREEE